MIRPIGSWFHVFDRTGKRRLGKHRTRELAEAQERAIGHAIERRQRGEPQPPRKR